MSDGTPAGLLFVSVRISCDPLKLKSAVADKLRDDAGLVPVAVIVVAFAPAPSTRAAAATKKHFIKEVLPTTWIYFRRLIGGCLVGVKIYFARPVLCCR